MDWSPPWIPSQRSGNTPRRYWRNSDTRPNRFAGCEPPRPSEIPRDWTAGSRKRGITMRGRSYLFVPGNRPDRFLKALQSGADAVIIDLEDAVPAPLKIETRATVAAWLSAEHPVYVRVNGHGTEWHDDDVRSVAREGLRGLVLPKAQDPRRVAELSAQLPNSASLLPIVENAQGLWNPLDIARCPRVERLAFGHLDFQRDLGIDGENEEILFARSHLVFMSRLAGVGAPLDGITAALDDTEKLRQDVERARRL